MSKKLKTNLLLLLTAMIWGFAFVAQQMGMDYIDPFTFAAIRFFIGFLALLPVIWITDKKRAQSASVSSSVSGDKADTSAPVSEKTDRRLLLTGGLCCGISLGLASAVQQLALTTSPAGKVGFLTALYILFVPILGIFLKKKVGLKIWLSVAIAIVGMYLLCITDSFSLKPGDSLALLCSVIFAIQMLFADHFSPKLNGLKLSCSQFLVASVLNFILMLIWETPNISGILSAVVPLFYTGLLSSAVGYTLQIIAQKDSPPAVAALILSLESVFSVIGAWLILHQTMSLRETFGCLFMFAAIILAQLPGRARKSA